MFRLVLIFLALIGPRPSFQRHLAGKTRSSLFSNTRHGLYVERRGGGSILDYVGQNRMNPVQNVIVVLVVILEPQSMGLGGL